MSSRPPRADVTVRPATPQDAPAIVETVRQGFATYASFTPPGWKPPADVAVDDIILSSLATPRACAFVAEVAAEPAGHVILLPAAETRLKLDDRAVAHVTQVFVREAHWGSGVAAALHARMIDAARGAGFAHGRLFVLAAQARARGFYEREGWTAAGPPAFEPALGIDVVEYRREIA